MSKATIQKSPLPRRLQSLLTALILFASVLGVSVGVTPVASAANTESAKIGMPFTGKWAYNLQTSASCGAASSQTSHPSCHLTNPSTGYLWGHWSTDVYAADGTSVKIKPVSPTGSLSYAYVAVSDGSCGHRVVVTVKVDGNAVGQVYFDHLKNEVSSQTALNSAMSSGGGVVGQVDQTCHIGFAHAHIEFKNTSPATGYSCYYDHSTNNYTAGMTLSEGTPIGLLGANGTTTQQECIGSQPGGGSELQAPEVGDLTAVNQANGLEEIFYIGGDGAVWYRWQNTDGSWSAEHTLGGGAKAITAVKLPDGRIEIFYVGGDNAVWYRRQTAPNIDSWSAQQTIGGGAKQLTAVVASDGRIGVFYTGGDSAIWYRWQNTDGSWSAQYELGGGAKAITATKTVDGKIELFYIGGDNSVWHRWQTTANSNSWSAQYELGGGAKAITATNQANGLEEIFYIGGDGAVWYRWQGADGSWSSEHALGGGAKAITATKTVDGKIELFYIGGDNSVWHRWQNNDGSWSAQYELGGTVG